MSPNIRKPEHETLFGHKSFHFESEKYIDVAQVRKDKKSYRENDRVLNRWREKFI